MSIKNNLQRVYTLIVLSFVLILSEGFINSSVQAATIPELIGMKVGDYVNYRSDNSLDEVWRIWDIDGNKIQITTVEGHGYDTLRLGSTEEQKNEYVGKFEGVTGTEQDFVNAEEILDQACLKRFANTSLGLTTTNEVRSMRLKDIEPHLNQEKLQQAKEANEFGKTAEEKYNSFYTSGLFYAQYDDATNTNKTVYPAIDASVTPVNVQQTEYIYEYIQGNTQGDWEKLQGREETYADLADQEYNMFLADTLVTLHRSYVTFGVATWNPGILNSESIYRTSTGMSEHHYLLKPLVTIDLTRVNVNIGDPDMDGSKENRGWDISENEKSVALIMEWTIPANADASGAGTTITLPIEENERNLFVVDWGDGSAKQWFQGQDSFPTHTYKNSTSDTYTIMISGRVNTFGYSKEMVPEKTNTYSMYYTFTQYLTKLVQWGEITATGRYEPGKDASNESAYGFSQCQNLAGTIPTPGERTFMYAVSLEGLFRNCSHLAGTIPDGLFETTPNVNSFQSVFFSCSGLSGSIPGTLFLENEKAVDFSNAFYGCKRLSGIIPEALFFDKSGIQNFYRTFYGCEGLQGGEISINTEIAKNAKEMFYGCSKLEMLIFSATAKDFVGENMFQNCEALKAIILMYVPDSSGEVGNIGDNIGIQAETVFYVASEEVETFFEEAWTTISENQIHPVIELKGENPTYVKLHDEYIEQGYLIANRDDYESLYNNYGLSVEIKNIPINTDSTGEYEIYYLLSKEERAIKQLLKAGNYIDVGDNKLWRIWSMNGDKLEITPGGVNTGESEKFTLNGVEGYVDCVSLLNQACQEYVNQHTQLGKLSKIEVRSMKEEDIVGETNPKIDSAQIAGCKEDNHYGMECGEMFRQGILREYEGILTENGYVKGREFYTYETENGTVTSMEPKRPSAEDPVLVRHTSYVISNPIWKQIPGYSDTYGTLIGIEPCWLASNCVYASYDGANFRVRDICEAKMDAVILVRSGTNKYEESRGILPLVTIDASDLAGEGSGSMENPWKINGLEIG